MGGSALPDQQAALLEKIRQKTVVGGIIGLGYVGLPLAQHLCGVGYRVIGFDVDPVKIEFIEAGKSYIKHIDPAWIREMVGTKRFGATVEFSRLPEADCISICVPTPLDEHFGPDLQYVEATANSIAANLRKGQLVILESTTYPGTTAEMLLPILERGGLKVGQDFFLAFSPEREDPGNPKYTIRNIPKIIGGITPACTAVASAYYGMIFDKVVEVSSPAAAELTKLLENIFRSVNIALVNELKMLCDRMGIDIWEVVDAAATKPFGFMPFYPGPGLGGHCIPIDPFYLSWKAREYDFSTRFIELAGQINTQMPTYVITRLMEGMNELGKTVKDSRILVLGAAYKKDVDDMRESPSIHLIELLWKYGAKVDYNDPHIPKFPRLRKHAINLESVELTPANIASYDCVLIATDHTVYDYSLIVKHAQFVVDTRNATRHVAEGREKILKA